MAFSSEALMPQLGYIDLCDEARAAVARGDLGSGRKYFEQAFKIKPDSAEACYGLATVCYHMRDLEAAKGHFLEVQRLDPYHAGAVINLGALCNLEGNYEEAIKYLRKGIQLDSGRCEGYYNLGIAYRKLGRFELAIQAYREAHHLNPRMYEAVYNLANIYLEMERFDQALSHYRQALEINPGFRKAQESMAALQRKMREAKLQTVVKEDPFSMDTPVDDYDQDERLDRMLDPELDHERLTQFHGEAAEAAKITGAWLKVTEDLDASIRNLATRLTADSGGDLADALTQLRSNMKLFQDVSTKFDQRFENMGDLREKFLEVQ